MVRADPLSLIVTVWDHTREVRGNVWLPQRLQGNRHLRTLLVGAAMSASRTKGSYLKDKYHRLKARRGPMRAALAIAHKILVAAYRMLESGVGYRELGEAYLDQIDQTRTAANLKRRIERLSYDVTLTPKTLAPESESVGDAA